MSCVVKDTCWRTPFHLETDVEVTCTLTMMSSGLTVLTLVGLCVALRVMIMITVMITTLLYVSVYCLVHSVLSVCLSVCLSVSCDGCNCNWSGLTQLHDRRLLLIRLQYQLYIYHE